MKENKEFNFHTGGAKRPIGYRDVRWDISGQKAVT